MRALQAGNAPFDLELDLLRGIDDPAPSVLRRALKYLRPSSSRGEWGDVLDNTLIWLPLPVVAVGIEDNPEGVTATAVFSSETSRSHSLDIGGGLSMSRARTFTTTTGLTISCGSGEAVIGQFLIPFWRTVRKYRPIKGMGEWFDSIELGHYGERHARVAQRRCGRLRWSCLCAPCPVRAGRSAAVPRT